MAKAARKLEYGKRRSGDGIAHGAKESCVGVKIMEAARKLEYGKRRSGDGIAHGAKEATWA